MFLRLVWFLVFGLASVFCVFPYLSFAQSIDSVLGTNPTPFTLSITPQYPTPYGQETISLTSVSIDLTTVMLSVFVNNKQIYQGNVQPVSFSLGAAGTLSTVKAVITSNGLQYTQSLVVQPEDVALVAEPIASAPALYPGKPLVPIGGEVRVVAVPNLRNSDGKVSDPNTLSYAWTVDGAEDFSDSGIGKNALIVGSPLEYRQHTVSVVIQNQTEDETASDSIILTANQPSVLIYEDDPLLGILFNHSLSGSYALTDPEASFYAAPFSFPTNNGVPTLQWFLNNSPVQTGNLVTLRPTGSGKGNATLSLTSSEGSDTTAVASLSVSFGSNANSGLFGL